MTPQEWRFHSLANLGRTDAGSAIVDAVWSITPFGTIGIVLILNCERKWKAYINCIGVASVAGEDVDAQRIARYGAKVPFEVAFALFGKRGFRIDDYDGPCADPEWASKLQAGAPAEVSP